jgi:hypothetical protein
MPGIVFAAGYLGYIAPGGREHWIVQLLIAAVASVIFTGVGMIALVVAGFIVHQVAGTDHSPDFASPVMKRMMTASLLLVAFMFVRGLMQDRITERRLIRCVRDWEESRRNGADYLARTATDAVRGCAEEPEPEPYPDE